MNRTLSLSLALFFALTHCGAEASPSPSPAADAAADSAATADAAPVDDATRPATDVPATPDGGCTGALSRCGDLCTDMNSDRYNCGECDVRCNTSQTCEGGNCTVR